MKGRAQAPGDPGIIMRLPDLQFPFVFDVIEFLQIHHADLVHFRDGGERLARAPPYAYCRRPEAVRPR